MERDREDHLTARRFPARGRGSLLSATPNPTPPFPALLNCDIQETGARPRTAISRQTHGCAALARLTWSAEIASQS